MKMTIFGLVNSGIRFSLMIGQLEMVFCPDLLPIFRQFLHQLISNKDLQKNFELLYCQFLEW